MIRKILRACRDEQGIETLEWILIGAIIVGIAFAVYGPGAGIDTALTATINQISDKLSSAIGK